MLDLLIIHSHLQVKYLLFFLSEKYTNLTRIQVNLGRDILAGTNERYGLVEGETAGVEQDTMINFKNEIGARFVEVNISLYQ